MPQVKLTPETLDAQLQRALLPAWLVSGDEPLLVGEAADAIRERARAAGHTEREVHFIERAGDWDAVRASAGNLSLFGSRRVVELRLASARPGNAGSAAISALLERPDPDTVWLIVCPRLERETQSAEWVRRLEEVGGWVQAWPVAPERLPDWLGGRARRLGLTVARDALELLAERTEGNLLAADQELRKLALLGRDGRIEADAVLESVADSARFDVFQLGEAALAGEAPRALRVLAGLKAEGTEPTLVLWALVKALRDLWAAARGEQAPGPRWQRRNAALEQAARRAGSLSFARLIDRAARADRIAKGRQSGEPWDELALLAAELCGRAPLLSPQSVLK